MHENDPDAVVDDIAATRDKLKSTVEALSYKTDVSARAEETVEALASELSVRIGDAKRVAGDAAGELASDVAARARITLDETSEFARETIERANETTAVLVRGLTPAHVARGVRVGISSRPLVLALLGLVVMLGADLVRTGPRVDPNEL